MEREPSSETGVHTFPQLGRYSMTGLGLRPLMTPNPILILTRFPKIPEGMLRTYRMWILSKEAELQCPVQALLCSQVIGMKKDSNCRKTMGCVFSGKRFTP